MVKLKSFAKINLNLNILPNKLKSGLFPVKYINCQINLYDDIEIEKIENSLVVIKQKNSDVDIRIKELIQERIRLMELAKNAHNATELSQISPCSIEDRWAKPDAWAVWSPAKNRTQKLFTSDEIISLEECEKEAHLYAANMSTGGYKAVLRRGESVRCDNFCLVKDFCAQYKAMNTNEVNSDVISIEQAVEGLSNE